MTTTATDTRWHAVASPHGIASLRHTHWLSPELRAYDDAPGRWAGIDDRILGRGLPGAEPDVSLAPGESLAIGDLLLRAIERDGAPALRVFDPDSPSRRTLTGIASYPFDEKWAIEGRFEPAGEGETRVVRSVDGHERQEASVGTIALVVDETPVRLTVSRAASGFSAVIADATSGVDSYRFRFLPIAGPEDGGAVTVDFNRAFLPPCAFSDQYVCPLPPPGNRLSARVEAGERVAVRTD